MIVDTTRANRQFRTSATTNPVMKVLMSMTEIAIFSLIPSWMSAVSV